MGKVAFLFPGQGSQYVGMGKDLYEAFPLVREVYDVAEEILKLPIKQLSFDGPEEALTQTQYTQPAIFVHSVAVDRLLKEEEGIEPEGTAGHSLGEYSALVSAGAIAFEDALRLVKIRGELMQHAGEKNPGTMAAIMGASREQVEEICNRASQFGVVQPANFNSPGQIVISGSIEAVRKAMDIAREMGVRRVRELTVSGAFHSPLMKDALNGLVQALQEVEIRPARVPVYTNVEALPVTDPEEIRELLLQQLLSPVQWENIIRQMVTDGYDTFYEVGPGKVLQGLQKRIVPEFPCLAVGDLEKLQSLKVGNQV
ncbi:MAG: ACP S-malonyltransferase [Calditrichaeota bacterium]|nr:ACP S-malonyltransferase [Calditrichota bacterium]